MPHIDPFWFPIIGIVAFVLLILGARVIFRVMLVFLALLVIWFALYVVGIAPSPINYFKSDSVSTDSLYEAQISTNSQSPS